MTNLLTIALLNDQMNRARGEAFQLRLQSTRMDHAAEYLASQQRFADSLDLHIEADKLFIESQKWDRIARRYELAVIAEETEIDPHDCKIGPEDACDCQKEEEEEEIETQIDFLIEQATTEEDFSWEQVLDEGVYHRETREVNIELWEEPQSN